MSAKGLIRFAGAGRSLRRSKGDETGDHSDAAAMSRRTRRFFPRSPSASVSFLLLFLFHFFICYLIIYFSQFRITTEPFFSLFNIYEPHSGHVANRSCPGRAQRSSTKQIFIFFIDNFVRLISNILFFFCLFDTLCLCIRPD